MFCHFIDVAKDTYQITNWRGEMLVTVWPEGTVKFPWHSTRSIFRKTKRHGKINSQNKSASNVNNHKNVGTDGRPESDPKDQVVSHICECQWLLWPYHPWTKRSLDFQIRVKIETTVAWATCFQMIQLLTQSLMGMGGWEDIYRRIEVYYPRELARNGSALLTATRFHLEY
jgi:hypothetical protein